VNDDPVDDLQQGMTISDAPRRSWVSWLCYLLFAGAVAGGFIYLFYQFTLSWKIATAAVVFMLSYMGAMAWWATRSGGSGRGGM
jgi:hypothetical protein